MSVRVFELAAQVGLNTADLVGILEKISINKNDVSLLTDEEEQKVRLYLKENLNNTEYSCSPANCDMKAVMQEVYENHTSGENTDSDNEALLKAAGYIAVRAAKWYFGI